MAVVNCQYITLLNGGGGGGGGRGRGGLKVSAHYAWLTIAKLVY